jgi:hypothetical protein
LTDEGFLSAKEFHPPILPTLPITLLFFFSFSFI